MTADVLAALSAATVGSRELDLLVRPLVTLGPEPCWPWPRAVDKQGRGKIWINGKLLLAHRAVWQHLNGPIPLGKLLCHHCDNPSCVNPHHLYVGTHEANMQDMVERKRSFGATQPEKAKLIGKASGEANTWSAGVGNPKAKLTEEQVLAIFADARPTRLVAADYGVDRTIIQRIRGGKLWLALRSQAGRHE